MPTILCVDDDPSYIELLEVFVKKLGYNFASAMDGVVATQAVQNHKPDLIIMDYQMPAADGVTVLERIEKVLGHAQIPVIFLTGLPKIDEIKRRLEAYPRWRIMAKPVKFKLLEAYIRELLYKPQAPLERPEDPRKKTVVDLDNPEQAR